MLSSCGGSNYISSNNSVGLTGCSILKDLKIRTKYSVIGFMIFKSILKSCVIGLMIHKFYIKSSVIQWYGFINKFDFIMDLNGFVWIFLLKIQILKSEGEPSHM